MEPVVFPQNEFKWTICVVFILDSVVQFVLPHLQVTLQQSEDAVEAREKHIQMKPPHRAMQLVGESELLVSQVLSVVEQQFNFVDVKHLTIEDKLRGKVNRRVNSFNL